MSDNKFCKFVTKHNDGTENGTENTINVFHNNSAQTWNSKWKKNTYRIHWQVSVSSHVILC